MRVAYLLYDEFTMLDIVGPFQVFSSVPGFESLWVAAEAGPVSDHTRTGALVASMSLEQTLEADHRPDIVVVPGGLGTSKHLDGPEVEWIAKVHESTTWTTSVCTGSMLLAAAGLLDGVDATCHWAARDKLQALGATPSSKLVVINPELRIATSAGVSSGIDMALELVTHVRDTATAQAAQLSIEYDPQPPLNAGSPTTAPPELVELLKPALHELI